MKNRTLSTICHSVGRIFKAIRNSRRNFHCPIKPFEIHGPKIFHSAVFRTMEEKWTEKMNFCTNIDLRIKRFKVS